MSIRGISIVLRLRECRELCCAYSCINVQSLTMHSISVSNLVSHVPLETACPLFARRMAGLIGGSRCRRETVRKEERERETESMAADRRRWSDPFHFAAQGSSQGCALPLSTVAPDRRSRSRRFTAGSTHNRQLSKPRMPSP